MLLGWTAAKPCGQIPIDVNQNSELFGFWMGHDIDDPSIDEYAQGENVLANLYGQRIVGFCELVLKDRPYSLVVCERLTQTSEIVLFIPVRQTTLQ
jgi:hypothetical protein